MLRRTHHQPVLRLRRRARPEAEPPPHRGNALRRAPASGEGVCGMPAVPRGHPTLRQGHHLLLHRSAVLGLRGILRQGLLQPGGLREAGGTTGGRAGEIHPVPERHARRPRDIQGVPIRGGGGQLHLLERQKSKVRGSPDPEL